MILIGYLPSLASHWQTWLNQRDWITSGQMCLTTLTQLEVKMSKPKDVVLKKKAFYILLQNKKQHTVFLFHLFNFLTAQTTISYAAFIVVFVFFLFSTLQRNSAKAMKTINMDNNAKHFSSFPPPK